MRRSQAPALERILSLWQITASGVGIVIGAGIYVLIGTAASQAGNGLWFSFILAAALAALTGLSYAELAGLFPSAGAEYTFAKQAFGRFAGFMAGWLMIVGNLIAAAAVSIGFAYYLRHFVLVDPRLAALGLLGILTFVITTGMQRSIWLSVVLAVLQVLGLVLVIVAGAPHIGDRNLLEGTTAFGVLGGTALVFFAFIGFDEVVTLSEETRDPKRDVPRALLIALGISTILYVLVGIASVSAVGWQSLAASERPLGLVIEDDWGRSAAHIVALIAIASTSNTSLLVLTAASRLMYGMSRDGALPMSLSVLGERSRAPYVAALAGLTVSGSFAMLGDIELVASVTNFAVFFIFLVVNGAVIALRYRLPHGSRTFVVPWALGRLPVIPVLALLATSLMLVSIQPRAWALGLATVAVGAVAYLVPRPERPSLTAGDGDPRPPA